MTEPSVDRWVENLAATARTLPIRYLDRKAYAARYPGVTPSWDNCARRKENAIILRNASPSAYGAWLKETLARFDPPNPEENFVFINAWNEWAEGNHLEPCLKWGSSYLEATRDAASAR